MKSFTTLALGITLLTTSTFAVPVQVDEVLPSANTIHAHRITISAGATLGQRHASVLRANVARDMWKKRQDMTTEAAGLAASGSLSPLLSTDSETPTGTQPVAERAAPAAAASSAPVSVPSGGAVKAALGPGGTPVTTCTEANLLECTITEWRDAEVCFVELCLS